MKAVFRCDASQVIGGGHMIRCLTLARRLSQAGWRTVMAVAGGEAFTGFAASQGVEKIFLPAEAALLPEALIERIHDGCDLLVVDHYRLGRSYEKKLRDWAARILVIDDLADRAHDCDLLLDTTPGRTFDAYASLVPDRCKMLLGTDFAPLRREFRQKRKTALSRHLSNKPAARVLVSFGLTDPVGATLKALEALSQTSNQDLAVEVFLSGASPVYEDVRVLAAKLGSRVSIQGPVSDMADHMAGADLAVGACGGTALERCCLGLPSVVISLARNQEPMAEALSKREAVVYLGRYDKVDSEQIARAVHRVLTEPKRRCRMIRAAAGVCDGKGATRVALALTPQQQASAGPVSLRLAKLSDLELTYRWQCAPETRYYAVHPEVPSLPEHRDWFVETLSDEKRIMTVIECDGRPSGVFRLDPIPGSSAWRVSIYVAPSEHRKGLGSAALRFAARFWLNRPFFAQVLADNAASHRLFAGAGFARTGPGTYLLPPGPQRLAAP